MVQVSIVVLRSVLIPVCHFHVDVRAWSAFIVAWDLVLASVPCLKAASYQIHSRAGIQFLIKLKYL